LAFHRPKKQVQDLLSATGVHDQVPKVALDVCQRCLDKLTLNKNPGFDNVPIEHLKLYVFIYAYSLMQYYSTVMLLDFGYGVIIALLKNKHQL